MLKKITQHPSIDFQRIKQFALKVYNRADVRDRKKIYTQETVDAFDAAAAFLFSLECTVFEKYKEQGCDFDSDLRARAEYAEWRAYDVAMALRAGKKPTEVKDYDESNNNINYDQTATKATTDSLSEGFSGANITTIAAAAPPPLNLLNDIPKAPEDLTRPPAAAVSEEPKEVVLNGPSKVVATLEEERLKERTDVTTEEVVKKSPEVVVTVVKADELKKTEDEVMTKVEEAKKTPEEVKSPVASVKAEEAATAAAPMFNGVTSTRLGKSDWILIESSKTNQKFWFNEKTKEKSWEEPSIL